MKLAFSSRELRELCETQLLAERKFGIKTAGRLRQLLADFLMADNLNEIPGGELRDNGDGHLIAPLLEGYSVKVKVNHKDDRSLNTGEIDRTNVRRVLIHSIEKNGDDRA